MGCAFAVGSLGLSFPGYPYELTGVEWSPLARNYLDERGIATYKAVEDLPDGFSAHGIILNDVLEHVANPLTFVQELKRISTPETVISVNVPNFIDWRMNQILKLVNSGSSCVPKDLNPWEHLSYFSPQSLNLLFSKIGATRVRQSTIELRTGGSGLRQLSSMIIRANRDAIRGFRGTYPDNYTTQGIFQFSDF